MKFTLDLKDFIEAIKGSKPKTSAYDTTAVVKRIEGNIAWVHIPGGIDETPVKLTIHAKKGDTVQVRVSGGSAFLVGNSSAPPTDDTKANQAVVRSENAELMAIQAKELAEDAAARNAAMAQEFASAVVTINSDLEDLQSQVDGNITSWFYAFAPTTSNAPASDWTTTDEKNNHLGDLFYDTTTGYAYRWMLSGTTYSWSRITDTDVSTALANAQAAQDTADGKRRVFITTPTPPYDVGDLWCVGATGDILTCTTAKTDSQSYSSSDWSKLNKYTDDSALNTFLSGTYASDKTNLQDQIDGKAETWYQSADPSTAWTTAALKAQHEGDLWYKTTDDTTWYYNGTTWVQQNIPTSVFDKIDGKAQIFTSQPTTPYSVGDLWFNSSTSDIMTCINARSSGNYTASDWEKRNKYTDDTVANAANTLATNTNQYFWFESTGSDTGAHISETPQDDWNDSENQNYHTGANLLARSNGIALRNGLTELATFGASLVELGKNSLSSIIKMCGGRGEISIANDTYSSFTIESKEHTNAGVTDSSIYLHADAPSIPWNYQPSIYLSARKYESSSTPEDGLINLTANRINAGGYFCPAYLVFGDAEDYVYGITSFAGFFKGRANSDIDGNGTNLTDANDAPYNSAIRIGSAATANNISHLAEKKMSKLITFGGSANRLCQIQWLDDDTNSMYVRNNKTGSWTEWMQINLSDRITSWANNLSVVSNQATIRQGGYYSEGKHVYVQMQIRVSSSLAADTTLSEFITGFPTPKDTLVVLSIATGGGAYGFASITADGKMNIRLNKQTGTSTNIYITGSYTSA